MKKIVIVFICVFILSTIMICFAEEGNSENGRKLFSAPDLAGSQNEKACISCHPGENAFNSLSKKKDLKKIINICITNALAGKALKGDSQEMMDLKSFIQSQAK